MNPNFKKVAVKSNISSIKDIIESEKNLDQKRKAELKPYKPNVKGYLKKYAAHVSSAAEGAIEIYED